MNKDLPISSRDGTETVNIDGFTPMESYHNMQKNTQKREYHLGREFDRGNSKSSLISSIDSQTRDVLQLLANHANDANPV